jgi:diguanylate cyclase
LGEIIILRELFINMAILFSVISLTCQLLKNHEISPSASIKIKIVIGVVSGILGIALMLFGLNIGENTIIDFRNVIIVLAALQSGAISAIICGIIIVIFRIVYFGINISSIFALALAIIIVFGSILISTFKIKQSQKWIYSTVFNIIFSGIAIAILVKGKVNVFNVLLTYGALTSIVSAAAYYYSNYCLSANMIFRKLSDESTKDFLTGLNNVRSFDSYFNSAIKNVKENGEKLSLLMIDIDFFKKVNDTYGHGDGDIVLKELGKVLSKSCRGFDIVSRNGGEEFTVLLLDCPKEKALLIAERIRSNIETHQFILSSGTQISITVSIGVTSYPESLNEVEKLVEMSDMALYAAKHTGRNRVCSDKDCSENPLFIA